MPPCTKVMQQIPRLGVKTCRRRSLVFGHKERPEWGLRPRRHKTALTVLRIVRVICLYHFARVAREFQETIL